MPDQATPSEAQAEAEAQGMLGTTDGAEVYAQICQGCHMPDAQGAQGAGNYPAFANNPAMASSHYLAITILNGRRNMPAFARDPARDSFFEAVWLSDEQIANVINHIRSHFSNDYPDPITPAEVRALRPAATKADAAH
jgi:mono/diheme cytochrome c family protein